MPHQKYPSSLQKVGDMIAFDLNPGTYVVAVSGGVDSMVLLDALRLRPGLKLIVAHYDHGIREDSGYDRQLVQQTAKRHQLPFVYDQGNLGYGASEDAARKARYAFLHRVREISGAQAIITAHHEDDVIETAFLNLIRGTGRRGITSLASSETMVRPLLGVPKSELKDYAIRHGLGWREDVTNQDVRYRRNAIRHQVMPNLQPTQRAQLIQNINHLHEINRELEHQLVHYLHMQSEAATLDRPEFIRLPHAVAREVMAAWLRHNGSNNYDRKTLERLVVAAKTFRPGQRTDISRNTFLIIHKHKLAFERLAC